MANRLDALSEQLSDVNPNNNVVFAVPAIQSAQDLQFFNQFLEQLSASCGNPIDTFNGSTLSGASSLANAAASNNLLDSLTTTTTATTATNTNGSLDLLNVALDSSANDVVYPDLTAILSDLATATATATAAPATTATTTAAKPLPPAELVTSSLLTNHLGSSIEQAFYPDLQNMLGITTAPHQQYDAVSNSPYPDLTQVLPSQHTPSSAAGGSDRIQEAKRVPIHMADRGALLRQVLLSPRQTREPSDNARPSKKESAGAKNDDIDIEQLSEELAGLGLQRKSLIPADDDGDDEDSCDDGDNHLATNDDSCNARQRHAEFLHMLYVKVNQAFRCRSVGQASPPVSHSSVSA